MNVSSGQMFKQAVASNKPLQVLGTINAYCALLAQSAGAKAVYVSGAGVANANYGLPDLGMTSLPEVLEEVRRINYVCPLPILVDVDTGWGHAFNIARTVQSMEKAGAAAIHIEDQVIAKRCGHRPNKAVVSIQEMKDRIKTAVDARVDDDFVIMARTDAFAMEGLHAAIDRASEYVAAGADMIFAEAITQLSEYQQFTHAIQVPVLANCTEFGKTPLFTREELKEVGIALILYPLSAFRSMAQAALHTYEAIINQGTQKELIKKMQTREQLYEFLNYHQYEQQLDRLMGEEHD